MADSDCEEGLICLKQTEFVDGKPYLEKWGSCAQDLDKDGIANDGDYSGSSTDNPCGVRALLDPETGIEKVYSEVLTECDDNCSEVENSTLLKEFDCAARDSCCPISEDEKQSARTYNRCSDLTEEPNGCMECKDTRGAPLRCYISFSEGYHLDEWGCIHCEPMKPEERVVCSVESGVDSCTTEPKLPKPACSGNWACNFGVCKFVPQLFSSQDENGFNIYYQLDRDADGVGDRCDNCPDTPNGLDCQEPIFEGRCDINRDGTTTADELAKGNQTNSDGDPWGDACDLCPGLVNKDNTDTDGDGKANPCDLDDDGDGICDPGNKGPECIGEDNCPLNINPNQEDIDGDGIGDACDIDRDGDGIREDGDESGVVGDNPCNPVIGPCCDSNPTEPCKAGVLCRNCDDNCPNVKNQDQKDSDNDGLGDACDNG